MRPLEYSSPIEQRSRQSVVMCVILSIVAPQAFESLMSFTYTGGGLPIVISHQKQPETHKALLVMDRKDDFIAFDTETQSSKIYEKSDIFWQLEKAALNSKNNNATIVSNKET
ncbi:hypothetical protein [Candidatus Odyssella thessalonicensis]|uniref:hypothetical protein n=1 Tax=Candidatus Odyssella thessalonicensis TaxID=84647 RepID=UPI0011123121|nr:hypothetical protein [Candidatus Odyssella thessalonicensis]